MTQAVGFEIEQGVAVLTFQSVPANALNARLRDQIAAALEQAMSDTTVHAVLLIGAGSTFSAGVDFSELGKPEDGLSLSGLCRRIENAAKPVVAALHGLTLGGGVELALACHYRLAEARCMLSIPEVGLGLISGAGGTQRAPRLVGAAASLQLMLSGRSMPVTAPGLRPLMDRILRGDLRQGGVSFAAKLIEAEAPLRRTCDQSQGFSDMVAYQSEIAEWAKRVPKHDLAAGEVLRCVEAAALLPFEVGLDFERACFERLQVSEQSDALRHVALAERRAVRFTELSDGQAGVVNQIGVIGAGGEGASIAVACLVSGYEVVLVEASTALMTAGVARVNALLDRAVTGGQLSELKRDGIEASLHIKPDLVALSEADLIIEATHQDRAGTQAIFSQLDAVVKDGAVLVTHGALAPVDQLAAKTGCVQDVLGVFFPTAAHLSPGVEVAIGTHTGADAVATLVAVLKKLGKIPVRAKASSGLVGMTVMSACLRAGEDLIRKGSDPYEIDRVMRRWGLSLGPFQTADLGGLEAPWLLDIAAEMSVALAALGHTGRKHRSGWYRYDKQSPQGGQNPDATQLVQNRHQATDKAPNAVAQSEITQTCLAAMANAGARLLRQGVVRHPSDIDVALIHGFGFPRWRGGPMMASDHFGLVSLRATLRDMAQGGDPFWAPEEVFDTLIKNGQGFASLNG